jgi:hypothetical protein
MCRGHVVQLIMMAGVGGLWQVLMVVCKQFWLFLVLCPKLRIPLWLWWWVVNFCTASLCENVVV